MKYLFYSLLLLSLLAAASGNDCPTREKAVSCFFDKGDYDHDGAVSKSDLDKVARDYLPWYLRIPFSVFGGSDQILQDCDLNSDNLISRDEAQNSATCLETCEKRQQVTQLLCY